MGACGVRTDQSQHTNAKIVLFKNCPTCDDPFDSSRHESVTICSSGHQICSLCINSIRARAITKQSQTIRCPICKGPCNQSLLTSDTQLNNFLKEEEETLRKLPINRRKLYTFVSSCLPQVKKYLRDSTEEDVFGNRFINKAEHLESISFDGRLPEDYRFVELDMFECLPNLTQLLLDHNSIRAIEPRSYSLSSINTLSLNHNQITSMSELIQKSKDCFTNLRVLRLGHNQIQLISALQHLPNLEVLDLNNNQIKRLDGLDKARSLTHINLEFNQIGGRWVNLPCYDGLQSLQLFGNKLKVDFWQKFSRQKWEQLRLLTVSINTKDITEKQEMCQQLYELNQEYLQFMVFESFMEEDQHFEEFDLEMTGLKFVEIYASTYKKHLQSDSSFLSKAVRAAKLFHPCGENTNFSVKAADTSPKLYRFTAGTSTYTKLDNSSDPTGFLYDKSHPMHNNISQRKFIYFEAKDLKMSIGICESTAGKDGAVDIDLEKKTVKSDITGEIPFDQQQEASRTETSYIHINKGIPSLIKGPSGIKGPSIFRRPTVSALKREETRQDEEEEKVNQDEKGDEINHEVLLSFDVYSMDLRLWIDGSLEHVMTVPNKWRNFRFYINMKRKSSFIRVIRKEL